MHGPRVAKRKSEFRRFSLRFLMVSNLSKDFMMRNNSWQEQPNKKRESIFPVASKVCLIMNYPVANKSLRFIGSEEK